MKYTKPQIRSLNHNSARGWCGTGSGAATDGCTVGHSVAVYCAAGAAANHTACVDGGSAFDCALGSAATVTWTRCVMGNSPTS